MSQSFKFFTPGPAQLYPTFEKHLATFVQKQLGSVSHRSGQYRDIQKFTVEQLRTLLNVPDSHQILFLGSASETWERILLNCVEFESFHLVNGSFSKKFFQYAAALNKYAKKLEKPLGEGFQLNEIEVPQYAEVIAAVQNETSSGVQMPVSDIHQLAKKYPDKIVAVDMVSSAPYPELDYSLVDTAYFSVQKAFGLPAGLGVWIVSEKCLAKAEKLKGTENYSIGAHNDLITLWKNAEKFETPATPNTMLIYLLGKIAEDMNRIGVTQIRQETEKKAQSLYRFISTHPEFAPFVTTERHRSKTVIVANTKSPAADIIQKLKTERGLVLGSGYGDNKATQVRIANFPATTEEDISGLIQALTELY